MIRNVVFDMGGVLIAWDPARIVARLGLSGEDARLLLREVFQSVEWVSLDRGAITEEELLERAWSVFIPACPSGFTPLRSAASSGGRTSSGPSPAWRS